MEKEAKISKEKVLNEEKIKNKEDQEAIFTESGLNDTNTAFDLEKNNRHETLAKILGENLSEFPVDLYIPPDAMQVFLEIFEGPLDLLLYLIKKNNIDILDIPVAEITKQYVAYIELMNFLKLELIAEYLEMAAILVEIKSRMLLPKPKNENGEEEDPRAELVRRLQEYEKIKKAAEKLNDIPRLERDIFLAAATPPEFEVEKQHPEVDMEEILLAFSDVLRRVDLNEAHNIERESLSVRERMSIILAALKSDKFVEFTKFFSCNEGRAGVVVTFLAILEMTKEKILELVQSEPFAPIYVRLVA